jgi:hypothetical protein
MGRMEAGGRSCDPRGRSALIAAYREGLGLAAIVMTHGPAGTRISVAGEGAGGTLEVGVAEARWWCRRVADAECLAAAAMRRLQRCESQSGAAAGAAPQGARPPVSDDASNALALAAEAIAAAAKRLNVTLFSDEEIAAEAMAVAARVDEEIERLHRAGDLKSVNKSYRAYRIETSARGEKTLRYTEWMDKYRANLVRQLAAALRYV